MAKPEPAEKQSVSISGRNGGKRPGAGRKPGIPNVATREIKDIARAYGPEAIDRLWALAGAAESDAAKVAAIKEILDRGYGRPAQSVSLSGDSENPIAHVIELRAVYPKHDPKG